MSYVLCVLTNWVHCMVLAQLCKRDNHTPVVTNDVIDAVLRGLTASRINWNPTATNVNNINYEANLLITTNWPLLIKCSSIRTSLR